VLPTIYTSCYRAKILFVGIHYAWTVGSLLLYKAITVETDNYDSSGTESLQRITDYNQAIKINPNDALAYSRRKPWETIISSTLVASIYIAQLI